MEHLTGSWDPCGFLDRTLRATAIEYLCVEDIIIMCV